MIRQFPCDLCPSTATVHQTESQAGEWMTSHFCAAHQPAEINQSLLSQFRRTVSEEVTHQVVLDQLAREFAADAQVVLAVMLESLERLSSPENM